MRRREALEIGSGHSHRCERDRQFGARRRFQGASGDREQLE
jgi:hypothetical protein